VSTWFRGFGPLRLLLLGTVAALILLGPFSGGPVRFEGIALFTTLLAPVAFAVFVFVLPLDMLMTLVFMSGADDARRARLRRVMVTEAALLALLVLAWAGFVAQLLERP
jgi:hypothetical protein